MIHQDPWQFHLEHLVVVVMAVLDVLLLAAVVVLHVLLATMAVPLLLVGVAHSSSVKK